MSKEQKSQSNLRKVKLAYAHQPVLWAGSIYTETTLNEKTAPGVTMTLQDGCVVLERDNRVALIPVTNFKLIELE